MKKKVLLATLAIVLVVFVASSAVSVFAGEGDPCYTSRCNRVMEDFCYNVCLNHGGCDGASFKWGVCDEGLCDMEFWIHCNDGYVSQGHECSMPATNCIWF